MRYKLTSGELKAALKGLTIIIDTREKDNENIKKWLEKSKVNFKVQKLDHGDYSCMIPKESLKGIERDIYLDRRIVIEKKANIDEIAGNFSKADTPRLKSEFAHLEKHETRVYLFVEDNLFDKHIRNGKYRSQYDPKTLYARIKSLEAEYNTVVRPVHEDYMASEIYNTLYYFTRNLLNKEFEIIGGN